MPGGGGRTRSRSTSRGRERAARHRSSRRRSQDDHGRDRSRSRSRSRRRRSSRSSSRRRHSSRSSSRERERAARRRRRSRSRKRERCSPGRSRDRCGSPPGAGGGEQHWRGSEHGGGGRHWSGTDGSGDEQQRGRGRWGDARGGGSDSDRDDAGREVDWRRRVMERETPVASVFIKGLPADAEEAEVFALFEGYPNVVAARVLRDKLTGESRRLAFLDFASVDDARVLMESEQRWQLALRGCRLTLNYSTGGRSGDGPPQPAGDWICDMCSAINFARRLECYHCYTQRPANPRRVVADLNEPSHILKVSGLEPSTSEEELYAFCDGLVPASIRDLRVIKDKYTGAPRGFAFVELRSIADAGSLMLGLQGLVLPGQGTQLKACYAKAKDSMAGVGAAAAHGGTAADGAVGQPGDAALLAWQPKEFDPSALGGSEQPQQQQQAQPQQQQAQQQQQAAAGPGPGSAAAAAVASAAAGGGADASTAAALAAAGFAFDATSGYYYNPASGYFYDAKTSLYYHHSTAQWYRYDQGTGQYSVAGGGGQDAAVQHGPAQQGEPQPQPQPKVPTAADKRARAVIGSAPQYNAEGLLAAAALAQERDNEQKRLAAAKAARERAAAAKKAAAGKPGIGALPGTAAGGAGAAAAAPPPTAAVVADGAVQGVVYRSKWAQRAAAATAQQQQH